jgi:two-component system, chemotaxis family, response regulator Rcp1
MIPKILLIEDNSDDILITKEAFEETRLPYQLFVVRDGFETMNFLNQVDKYSDAPKPDLILLDLNLPQKSGKEILTEIKNNEKFKSIPVIILSTSSAQKDIKDCYSRYANSYIVKPIDFFEFVKIISNSYDYWFKSVKLIEVK